MVKEEQAGRPSLVGELDAASTRDGQTDLICRFRPDAKITFANEAYCGYFGRAREEVIGRSFIDLIPTADRELALRHLASLTLERPAAMVEHRVTLPNGEIRWQRWTDHAFFDGEGRLTEFHSVGRDVTEQKRAEQALRESEERYRALVTASADIIWRATADGNALFVSPSWRELTGQTDEQVKGSGWLDVVHPDDRNRTVAEWQEAMAARRPYESEIRVSSPEGGYRHFQARGVPILAEDGSIREWVGTTTDITARKEAEIALREGQRRHRLASAAGGVGVWDLDLETGEMYIDPELKRLLGFEDHEIQNRLDDWISRVYPADLERMQVGVDAHMAGLTPEYEVEHRMVRKDGSVRWFLARGRAVRVAGERPRLVGTDTDITARKQATEALREVQARHQAMLRAIPDLMFMLDKDGVYIDYHAADPASLLVPPEQFMGRNVHELFAPELARRMAHCIEEVVRSGAPAIFEYDLPLAGEIRHWEARIVRCDADKVLSIVRDRTERRRADNETRQLREELAHFDRVTLLAALTGSLAHEINQPLAAIMANAQAAERMLATARPDLGELRETLADIVEDDRRAGQVLHRLRALLTKETPESSFLDVKVLLEEMLGLVHSDTVMRRISLEVRLAPDLPVVRGDRVQLQQVALNLLINAFDAVEGLDVDRRRVVLDADRQGSQVVVSVIDQGLGVPTDALERIFEPFYTTKPEGMGLGLSICQTIAAAHGGVLDAALNADRGMTFSLRLPVAPEVPAGTPAAPPRRSGSFGPRTASD